MTALTVFRSEFDWSGRRIIVNLDVDAAYAARSGRNDYESNAARRIYNWVGSNFLSAYRSYFGKNTDADSYSTYMRSAYPIRFTFDDNRIVLDVRGGDYDKGLFDCFASQRDSFSLDLKNFIQTWLAAH